MNRKFLIVTIGVVAVLLVAAFWAGKAIATLGCFPDTNGNYFETYICWLKAHSITFGYGDGTFRPDNAITRGEMAAMLQRQAEVPPSTGLILITPGNGNWLKLFATDDISFNFLSDITEVMKAAAGDAFISIQPSIPTVLYGRELQLVGVEFCYQAAASTYLTYVELNTYASTTGEANYSPRVTDFTDRTDTACNYYAPPSPVTLTPIDGVNFFIKVHWNAGGTYFIISRTTFVLSPTDTLAVFSPPLTDIVVPLSEMDVPAKGSGTSAP